VKTIHVTETYMPDLHKYQQYVEQLFQSKWITNQGVLVQELQKRLEDYLGVKNILLVSNGTMALQIAYKVLELEGEVITTPFSFIATTSSMVWEGLTPVFADIDAESFNMDPKEIEKCITKDTSAIVPVHVFGNACEVEMIERIASRHGVKVIYDAAHAFSVDYKGKSVLNHGDISILSFHATKLFHTVEGGALIIKDDMLYRRAQAMINFGLDTYSGKGEVELLGINAKMNEFEAAMGLCVLDEIDHIASKRKKAVEYYEKYFQGKIQLQRYHMQATRNYSYFPVVFDSEQILMRVIDKLHAKKIFPRRYFFPSLETLSYLGFQKPQAVSDSLSRRILCLPLYPGIEETVQKEIVEVVLNSIL